MTAVTWPAETIDRCAEALWRQVTRSGLGQHWHDVATVHQDRWRSQALAVLDALHAETREERSAVPRGDQRRTVTTAVELGPWEDV